MTPTLDEKKFKELETQLWHRHASTQNGRGDGLYAPQYMNAGQFQIALREAIFATLRSVKQAEPDGWVVTDAMVDAYLKANTEYWHRLDADPFGQLPKDKRGTVKDATKISLQAALAAAPAAPQSDEQEKRDAAEASAPYGLEPWQAEPAKRHWPPTKEGKELYPADPADAGVFNRIAAPGREG